MLSWLYNLFGWSRKNEFDLPDADPSAAAKTPVPVPTSNATAPEPVNEAQPRPRQPASPEPEEVEVAPPWELGGAAPSMSPKQIDESLLSALSEHLESVQSSVERHFVQGIIDTVSRGRLDLPAFPDVARDLDELLREGDPMMNRVVRLVERDPGLVQKVWTRASGADFDAPPKGLHFAIARIGYDELWRIAIQVCLHSELFRVPGFQHQADHVRDHGLIVADGAAALANERRGPVYIAGLLHDVGKLVVYKHASVGLTYSAQAPQLVNRVVRALHASMGIQVARAWNLGEEVAAACGFHHAPERAPEDYRKYAWVIRAMDVSAHTVEGAEQGKKRDPFPALDKIPPEVTAGRDPLEVARKSYELFLRTFR